MEIRNLRYFCLTAELEHVTKAANQLGVSQPFLTKIIGQIEEEVGVKLFDDKGRSIKLNAYGKKYYTHAKKVIMEIENLQQSMEEMLDREDSTITVMSNTSVYFAEMVHEFQKANPKTLLKLSLTPREEIALALKTGKVDFALCYPALDEDMELCIKTENVFREYGCLITPPGHPLLEKGVCTVRDITKEPLILSPRGAVMREKMEELYKKFGYSLDNIVIETSDVHSIISAVKKGVGCSIMAKTILDKEPELKKNSVEIQDAEFFGDFGLSYNEILVKTKRKADFRMFVIDFFYDLQNP
ncbi:MAG: hypothetical protein H6Q58_1417 [Firmicutes bacterium]|nr:hypothetical protein [Bacillota bacterium]